MKITLMILFLFSGFVLSQEQTENQTEPAEMTLFDYHEKVKESFEKGFVSAGLLDILINTKLKPSTDQEKAEVEEFLPKREKLVKSIEDEFKEIIASVEAIYQAVSPNLSGKTGESFAKVHNFVLKVFTSLGAEKKKEKYMKKAIKQYTKMIEELTDTL